MARLDILPGKISCFSTSSNTNVVLFCFCVLHTRMTCHLVHKFDSNVCANYVTITVERFNIILKGCAFKYGDSDDDNSICIAFHLTEGNEVP